MTSILPHSQHVMVSVFAALVAGTAVYLWKSRTTPDGDFLELKLRIRSWWWMVGIIFIALFLPLQYTIVFFGFLSFMALKEFLSIVPIRLADRRVIFWAYLSIPLH